ncbi:MAG: hypothetical protein ACOCWM_06210 [Cyclobacteriaceae bacterium]
MKNSIAEIGKPDSLDLIKPEDASPEGDYYCPDKNCLDPERKLSLKISTLNNKYFSHRPSCDHNISSNLLLHKMVMAQLKLLPAILLPKTGFFTQPKLFDINHSKSRIAYDPELKSTPEIMLINNQEEMVYLDIIFNDEIPEDKYQAALQQNIPYFIMDLEDFYHDNSPRLNDIDFLQEAVPALLHNQEIKNWQYLPSKNYQISKMSATQLVAGAIVGMVGVAGYLWYRSGKSKS